MNTDLKRLEAEVVEHMRTAIAHLGIDGSTAGLTEHQAEPESFCACVREWRESRHRRHLHTPNDDRYDRFLPCGIDLSAVLGE